MKIDSIISSDFGLSVYIHSGNTQELSTTEHCFSFARAGEWELRGRLVQPSIWGNWKLAHRCSLSEAWLHAAFIVQRHRCPLEERCMRKKRSRDRHVKEYKLDNCPICSLTWWRGREGEGGLLRRAEETGGKGRGWVQTVRRGYMIKEPSMHLWKCPWSHCWSSQHINKNSKQSVGVLVLVEYQSSDMFLFKCQSVHHWDEGSHPKSYFVSILTACNLGLKC